MRSKYLLTIAAVTAVSVASATAAPRKVVDPANLRTGPGVAWPVIGVIPANGQVTIRTCATGASQGWCQVRYENMTGFVAAKTLTPSGAHGVMVAPLATRYSAHVRSNPSLHASVVAVIPPDAQVDVTGCKANWFRKWRHVKYEGKTGYIRQALLKRVNAVLGN